MRIKTCIASIVTIAAATAGIMIPAASANAAGYRGGSFTGHAYKSFQDAYDDAFSGASMNAHLARAEEALHGHPEVVCAPSWTKDLSFTIEVDNGDGTKTPSKWYEYEIGWGCYVPGN
ncbi:hypothetical protein [Streptomyces sp. NPDC048419]|uniref:hypothetical protein n=1 Tax=Streptomyces sp. NPDC048419 TaxID=3365547 RepID=UPI003716F2A0